MRMGINWLIIADPNQHYIGTLLHGAGRFIPGCGLEPEHSPGITMGGEL